VKQSDYTEVKQCREKYYRPLLKEDGAKAHLPRRWRFLPGEPEGMEELDKELPEGYLGSLFYFLCVICVGFLICELRGCDDSEAEGARSPCFLHCR